MKFTVLVFILFVLIQYNDCHSVDWTPQNLVNVFTNKTAQISDYVRTRGRELKHFYVNNLRKKIHNIFGLNSKTIREEDYQSTKKMKRKLKSYIDDAAAGNNNIFDSIAPMKDNYLCNDKDPYNKLTTPQLIALHGYRSESHTIITEDGYILTVHRIPYVKNHTNNGTPQKTVLLHHGLLGSSADWVIPGPEKGLAYILSNSGYDVWLANVRGNTYSRAHIKLDPDTFEYWNFTFHEVSQFDLPAVIDYIMEVSGWDVKIDYIGHSMGTTVLFALLSTKVKYNKILRAGFALAPVAFMTDIQSPIKLLAKYSNNLEIMLKLLGANEFLPQNAVLRWLSSHACEINHIEEAICENSMFVLCGHDEKQFNKTLLPLILSHVPAGASTKTLVHYAQEIKSGGRFQQFDYGPEGNLKEYGSYSPPQYQLHKITLPIALFGAENDWLASDEDVTNLFVQLVNPIEHYIVPLKEFNHIDFLWAIDARKLVFNKLLQLLEDGVSKSFFTSDLPNDINFEI